MFIASCQFTNASIKGGFVTKSVQLALARQDVKERESRDHFRCRGQSSVRVSCHGHARLLLRQSTVAPSRFTQGAYVTSGYSYLTNKEVGTNIEVNLHPNLELNAAIDFRKE